MKRNDKKVKIKNIESVDITNFSDSSDAQTEEEPLQTINCIPISPEEIGHRIICNTASEYTTLPNVVPTHIPHKKLWVKFEEQKFRVEPLQSFSQNQEDRQKYHSETEFGLRDDSYSKRGRQPIRFGFVSPQKKHTVVDQLKIIHHVKNTPNVGFLYMIYSVPRWSEFYGPYCLKVVPFPKIKLDRFLTISPQGVTQYFPGEMNFTPLDQWEREYLQYCKIINMQSFKLFRIWKSFYVWKKYVTRKKFKTAQKFLSKYLFILHPILKDALIEIQDEYLDVLSETYIDRTKIEENELFQWNEFQMGQLETMEENVIRFHSVVLEITYKSCLDALARVGFVPNDENFLPRDMKMPVGVTVLFGKTKMTYTQQANKRRFCLRLSNFIHLVDYKMITMMHRLLRQSYEDLEDLFQMHNKFLPDFDSCTGSDVKEILEKERPDNTPKVPLFIVDLLCEYDNPEIKEIVLDPNEKIYFEALLQLLTLWEDKLNVIPIFLNEQKFDIFSQPMVNGKQDERVGIRGPILDEFLDSDPQISILKDNIYKLLHTNMIHVKTYGHRFNYVSEYLTKNALIAHESIKKETVLKVFRAWLTEFHEQIEKIALIPDKQNLGIFLIQMVRFKQFALPYTYELLDVIHDVLPAIGRIKIEELSAEATDAVAFLEYEPADTLGFVGYLSFLDKCQKTLDIMDNESEYSKELYDLVEEFQIPCPSEDIMNYLNFSVILTTFRNTVDLLFADRGRLIELFNGLLNKDINELILQVGNIGFEASQPWLIDIQSNAAEVKETLQRFNDELQECVEKVNQVKAYQKQFRIEVTRFEMVDDVIEDVKLRNLLWDSLFNWDTIVSEWFDKDFSLIDPEEINIVTTKYVKNVFQLEKGLPPNEIVPLLKDKVEDIKNKLPVIYNLRNPAFKARHWLMIEDILDYKFKRDAILTIKLLDEIKAFDHPDELQEISAQASSEQGLELLLKKVEELWLSLEFMVIPYRDIKDVYILAGLDEMQQFIEDTNINLSTIISSRYVGPIKPRVEDWVEKMKLFVKTLDEWLECQQVWIYLEQIFTAPDIQRQLPTEAKLFTMVDKSFKDIMRTTQKTPLAMTACIKPGMLETFQNNNNMLDQIMKCLEAYLETKRVAFPRFYFLSNDELIEILAQTRNPHAVQPHLRKCFDGISKLEFGVKVIGSLGDDPTAIPIGADIIFTTDIIAMLSPEGERVELIKGLKARGNVEDWLGKVEEAMVISLSRKMKISLGEYYVTPKTTWIFEHPSQIILTINQIIWASKVHEIMKKSNPVQELKDFQKYSFNDLNILAGIVRGQLNSLGRLIMSNLITVAVHARDIITTMCNLQISSTNHFEWLKQLRYYWIEPADIVEARMSSSSYLYKYEYLGALTRLVITPLTDRCYLCLMGALQLDLGGCPAGPAGTGKTETTKDLAKSLAVLCVVFNCSEGLDYKIMGRFFAGLAQCGAWCCFDEFNRIEIEVLSVIAQQLITIRNAKAAHAKRFMFEGREIKLEHTCATFITMNPGYAGRTELPDNLKALFRPIAMMVPDYALIAEVILYSEGFELSRGLANKMVQMYKLCSEQLSQQDHYDFGMRAVKSVLVMAGSLKRQNPDKSEDVVLIRALRDSNIPKFLADDVELFQGIINDLFPGVEIPEQDYGEFQEAIITIMTNANLQPEGSMIIKVIQLYETMLVRHGVMLVGPTGGGKSTVLNILKGTLSKLEEDGVENPYYHNVVTFILNPKSITIGELYGEVNPLTLEWHDGLLGIIVRKTCQATNEDHQWVVCDGPVDAVWIENMNTVLDDNKMLCLANSERIKLTPYVHMVFEVEDLCQASPATVSRCGMVYIDPNDIKFMPYVKSWLNKLKIPFLNEENKEYIQSLFEKYISLILNFVKKNCEVAIMQVEIGKVSMLCSLFESLMIDPDTFDETLDKNRMRTLICQSFVFCCIWCLGGNVMEKDRDTIDIFIRDQFEEDPDAHIPGALGDLWNLWVNFPQNKMDVWIKLVPKYIYDPKVPFFEMLVPTIDTVRFGYLLKQFMKVNKPILFTGLTGVGKTVIAKSVLKTLTKDSQYVSIMINFSAQTSSGRTQEIIESKLERKSKTLIGAPVGKRAIIFVDDVNMPKQDRYGSQPPIELLRQFLDYGGFYDRDKLFWVMIKDVILMAACAPPGGGRNPITPRFMRHFGMLFIPKPTEVALKVIFKAIISGFLKDFADPVKAIGDKIVVAAVEVYSRIAVEFLPTPTKSHYVFNLRDLSKCIQGILQADSGIVIDTPDILRLFYHESLRVFHDRLINIEDKSYFYILMKEVCMRCFNNPIIDIEINENTVTNPPVLLYGDFIQIGAAKENRIYEELINIQKLKTILQDYLDDFNLSSSIELKLIFFMDAIEHMCRIARILRSERGNALLVGVGGMGKRSLTMLASHVNSYRCMQIELTRNYDHLSFFEDIRTFYYEAGVIGHDTVFLFSDTQIVIEEFLEDINNMLNTGEVPNLYDSESYEKVIIGTRPAAKKVKIAENARDQIFEFFISRVRSKLHVVLCMSPVGDSFRGRCRMFPSLVNCCTIDWFSEWPEEALLSVATDCFKEIPDELLQHNLSKICVSIHESVTKMTHRFYAEVRRRYYTTPSSYLELLKLYTSLLYAQRDKISKKKNRIENGLRKLLETNDLVETMKIELTEMGPQLVQKSADTEKLLEYLSQETARADKVRGIVKADETQVKVKAKETQELADDAQRDLDAALPLLEQALLALASLNKNDINEIRVFVKPPRLVQFVMEAVCVLLNKKADWMTAKQVMADTNFLKYLQEYEKDKINDKMLDKLKTYVDDPDFVPDKVAKQSKVCMSMCKWVIAIDAYAKVYRIVEPKKRRLREAETELEQVMVLLKEKQQMLAEVEHQIAELEATFEASMAERNFLENSIELCNARLGRSGRLISALGDEQERWNDTIRELGAELVNMIGDILLASGSIAYLGAFTSFYREILVKSWLSQILELQIPASRNFGLIQVLADPYDVSMWNVYGLPRDSVSTENAIMVTRGLRWPLMIDPQEQANRWIRQMESKNSLKIVKLSDPNYMRVLESAIRVGMPVLMEDMGEQVDPALVPILKKQTYTVAGRLLIRLGDSEVDYDPHFKFYMTSKMANPHYLPEVCILVTIVNFTVTPSGLEDQLLSDVVRLERPDLEKQRNELVLKINSDKAQLQFIEDKILKKLFSSEGNILDDEELIETLTESKETSAIIATRLVDSEATEELISIAREKYRSVANRGSCLFFVVANLAEIDPMYQYSLKYFTQVFDTVIVTSAKSIDLNIRLQTLIKQITLAIYVNVSRGLFEKHKLVYSFMLCCAIFKNIGKISETQFKFLLRGPGGAKMKLPKAPDISQLTEYMWLSLNFMEEYFPVFNNITQKINQKIKISIGDFLQVISINPKAKEEINLNEQLNDFEKLMLLRVLREEKLLFALTEYVKLNMGKTFIESPQVSLNLLFKDTSKMTPLIFILSTGSDPFSSFQRFAGDMGYADKYTSISLGQGQGPVAEKLIFQAISTGDWVFLQNCHLATSWMPAMEQLLKDIEITPDNIHPKFRLFLSSMPENRFPVSVLQNSVKVTNEPPKGLRANIKRAFVELNKQFFEEHVLGPKWKKMIFGICFFHAVIQERKKFGPLGWNITYEFNDSDRECALNTIKMFCEDGNIAWDALEYITSQITYGGRVTDYWDQRCLSSILKGFFSPKILNQGYTYSKSGVYYCPESENIFKLNDYRNFIDKLPLIEQPEIFGMHENANIAFQKKETQEVINTILGIQPQETGSSEGKSSDVIVYEIAQSILDSVVFFIDPDESLPILLKRDEGDRLPSLSTVLFHEIDRFNKMFKVLEQSLDSLQKAIKGFVVMSEALEEVYNSFTNNLVPNMWSQVGYLSMKPLGSWVKDLLVRIDFIQNWLTRGPPISFWISGFFFPQGFLTGVLQSYSRKYNFPIDELKFEFDVKTLILSQEEIMLYRQGQNKNVDELFSELEIPQDGVLVHGLFLDAGRWDMRNMMLADAFPGEIHPPLPVLHLLPCGTLTSEEGTRYTTPLYKTAVRAGVLSTTGHSTNFVLPILLPTNVDSNEWILRGTALLTQTSD